MTEQRNQSMVTKPHKGINERTKESVIHLSICTSKNDEGTKVTMQNKGICQNLKEQRFPSSNQSITEHRNMRIFCFRNIYKPQEMIKEAIIPQTLLSITPSSPSSGTDEAH
jgi:uncharacterized circularly permuted ATP-grasp superfamily protein